jgi:hypothetical protein
LTDVIAISTTNQHNLALKQDGTVWAWGWNQSGQLGDLSTANRSKPVLVVGLTNVAAIAAGGSHSLAVQQDGTVWTWGADTDGQLGDGSVTNRSQAASITGIRSARFVAAGSQHSLAAVSDPDPDFNHDGNHDLIWRNTQTGDMTVAYLNENVSQGLWDGSYDYLGHSIPTQWQLVGTAALSGGQTNDLVWQNTQSGDLTYWRMNGTQSIGYGYLAYGIPLEWKCVGIADFNGDGKPDLLWQNTLTGDVSVWYMDGVSYTEKWDYIAQGLPLSWQIVGTADLDGDGHPDLVWRNTQTGDVFYWLMNGTQHIGGDFIARNIPLAWKLSAITDINGDQNPDLVWQNLQTGDVSVWYLSGTAWTGGWDYIARSIPLDWKLAPLH